MRVRRTQPLVYALALLPLFAVVAALYAWVGSSALGLHQQQQQQQQQLQLLQTRGRLAEPDFASTIGNSVEGFSARSAEEDHTLLHGGEHDSVPEEMDDEPKPASGAESGALRPNTVTIVTAYFDMGGDHKIKHSHSFYLETGINLLSMKSPMIIFTDVELVGKSRAKVAPDQQTQVINIGLKDLKIFQNYLSEIKALHGKDPERQIYSPELYALYHAKPEIMRMAAELNPFKTSKLIWVDFGSMRDWGGIEAKDYRNKVWPNPERVHLLGEKGRILIQGTGGVTPKCQVNWANADPNSPGPQGLPVFADSSAVPETMQYWIAGALFGGDADALVKYERAYDAALVRYLATGKAKREVTLIDQHLMGALACERPDLVQVLRPPSGCCAKRTARKWFFMYMYLRSGDFPPTDYSKEELEARAKKQA